MNNRFFRILHTVSMIFFKKNLFFIKKKYIFAIIKKKINIYGFFEKNDT